MRPEGRWLAGAAALLWLILAARWAGLGWTLVYLAAGVALAASPWLGARLPASWPARHRPWLAVVGVHVVLIGVLAATHSWSPIPLSAVYAPVARGAAPARSTEQLQATAQRLLKAKQWGRAVQPLQELAARTPAASAYLLLGEAKAEAGQVGTSPYTLDTARFLGARGTSLEAALGRWEMRAGGAHPAYLLLALAAFHAAAAATAGSQKTQYEQLAATVTARATQVFGAAPEPMDSAAAPAAGG